MPSLESLGFEPEQSTTPPSLESLGFEPEPEPEDPLKKPITRAEDLPSDEHLQAHHDAYVQRALADPTGIIGTTLLGMPGGVRQAQPALHGGQPVTARDIPKPVPLPGTPASRLKEAVSTPAIPFSKLAPENPTTIPGEIGKHVAQFAEGLTTPGNILLAGATEGLGLLATPAAGVAKYLPRAVSAVFGAQMLKGAIDSIPEVKDAIAKKDYQRAAGAITDVALNGGMAGLALLHAGGAHAGGGDREAAVMQATQPQPETQPAQPQPINQRVVDSVTSGMQALDRTEPGETPAEGQQPPINGNDVTAQPPTNGAQNVPAQPQPAAGGLTPEQQSHVAAIEKSLAPIEQPTAQNSPSNEGANQAVPEPAGPAPMEQPAPGDVALTWQEDYARKRDALQRILEEQRSNLPAHVYEATAVTRRAGRSEPSAGDRQSQQAARADEPLYRGRPSGPEAETVGGGKFYSPDRNIAETYAGPKGIVEERPNDFKNVLTAKNWAEAKKAAGLPQSATMADLVNKARELGHDAVSFTTKNGVEYVSTEQPNQDVVRGTSQAPLEPSTGPEQPMPEGQRATRDSSIAATRTVGPAPSDSPDKSAATADVKPPSLETLGFERETAPSHGLKALGFEPEAPEPGSVARVPTSSLSIDPARFQFKQRATGKAGVTDEFSEVRKFDPEKSGILSVWHDPSDGKTYVVNGHHRFELADRLGHPELAVRYIDAADAADARTRGAMINIAEGRGDALDAAKIFRDSGYDAARLEREEGISLKGEKARQGLALSRLDPYIFRKVVDGDLPIERAAIIGEGIENPNDQRQLYDRIQENPKLTNGQIGEMVRFANADTAKTTETQHSLFGSEEMTRSLIKEKAEVSDYIRKRLGQERKLFAAVGNEGAAAKLADTGNKIEAGKNALVAHETGQAQELYDKLSTSGGPISDELNNAASLLANGESSRDVKERAYKSIKSALVDQARKLTGRADTGSVEGVEGGARGRRSATGTGEHDRTAADANAGPSQTAGFSRTSVEGATLERASKRQEHENYPAASPLEIHGHNAVYERIKLPAEHDKNAAAFVTNMSGLELFKRGIGAPVDEGGLRTGGLHISPKDAKRLSTMLAKREGFKLGFTNRVRNTPGFFELHMAIDQAAEEGKSFILQRDAEHLTDSKRSVILTEELHHAAQNRLTPESSMAAHGLKPYNEEHSAEFRDAFLDHPLTKIRLVESDRRAAVGTGRRKGLG